MKRKNVLEYIMLALFIMCMALAMSAALEYSSVGTERPFMLQAVWMLSLVLISLILYVGIRIVNKAAPHIPNLAKNWMTASVCLLLLAAGFLLRVAVIEHIPIEPDSDFETYYRIARELLSGTLLSPEGDLDRRYIAMYPHTIGFPMLVLVPAFRLFGESVKVALYANLACSMVSIAVCAHIGKRLAGRMGAVIATLLMSFWPSHVLYANMVATEQSFTMLILIAADMMISVLGRDETSLYALNPGRVLALLVVIGIVLAIAGAVRPMAVVLLAAFLVVQLTRGGDPEGKVPLDGMRYALSAGWFCALLVLIPYVMTGAIISRSISDQILEAPAGGLTASGYNLMVGVNVKAEGHWNEEDSAFFEAAYEETGDASEAHRRCMQVAFQRISDEPENVLNLLIYKFRDLWQTDDFGIDWNLLWTEQQGTLTPELKQTLEDVRPVGRLLYMAVLLYALLCAVSAWRGRRAPQPMVMVFVLFYLGTALAHMLLETQVRYHYNMLPFLMLLATVGVVEWRERVAQEPPVRTVYRVRDLTVSEHDDHTHFDMNAALKSGNVRISVSEAYAAAQPAPQEDVPAPQRQDAPRQDDPPAEALPEVSVQPDVQLIPVEPAQPDVPPVPEVPAHPNVQPVPEEPVQPVILPTNPLESSRRANAPVLRPAPLPVSLRSAAVRHDDRDLSRRSRQSEAEAQREMRAMERASRRRRRTLMAQRQQRRDEQRPES